MAREWREWNGEAHSEGSEGMRRGRSRKLGAAVCVESGRKWRRRRSSSPAKDSSAPSIYGWRLHCNRNSSGIALPDGKG